MEHKSCGRNLCLISNAYIVLYLLMVRKTKLRGVPIFAYITLKAHLVAVAVIIVVVAVAVAVVVDKVVVGRTVIRFSVRSKFEFEEVVNGEFPTVFSLGH